MVLCNKNKYQNRKTGIGCKITETLTGVEFCPFRQFKTRLKMVQKPENTANCVFAESYGALYSCESKSAVK
jgi:hypothetical protein